MHGPSSRVSVEAEESRWENSVLVRLGALALALNPGRFVHLPMQQRSLAGVNARKKNPRAAHRRHIRQKRESAGIRGRKRKTHRITSKKARKIMHRMKMAAKSMEEDFKAQGIDVDALMSEFCLLVLCACVPASL